MALTDDEKVLVHAADLFCWPHRSFVLIHHDRLYLTAEAILVLHRDPQAYIQLFRFAHMAAELAGQIDHWGIVEKAMEDVACYAYPVVNPDYAHVLYEFNLPVLRERIFPPLEESVWT
jgi:hypothetical protein